ncbi:MAG: hypothetical protein D6732_25250 [Methanobacteriota archaeon]|nr:MAG: hypothetical protein D6732_25250 [Euryarchaeota archaeon]
MSRAIERSRIVGLTDEMTSLGLRLAGIKNVYSVPEGDNGRDLLRKLVQDDSVAVLIITEKYAEMNRRILDRAALRPWPVIVEIPGPEGKMERETSTLKTLVKNALGIELEL